MKTRVLIIGIVIILAASITWAWATPQYPQPQNQYQEQGQHQTQIQGQQQGLVNQPNQTITVNGVPIAQTTTITPAPVVVQEAPKVVPVGLPYLQNQYPPMVQSPDEGAATRAAGSVKPWNVAASHWKTDVWPVRLIKEPKSMKGIEIIEPSSGEQFPVASKNMKKDKDPALTVYKGTVKTKEWAAPHVIQRRIFRATDAGITMMQLQDAAMWWAVGLQANGLRVNQETFYLRNNQKGGGITVGMLASALGSILGQAAVWGPGVQVGWQNYDGVTDAYPVLDVEAIQVQ